MISPAHFRSRVNPWIAVVLLGSLLICVVALLRLIADIGELPLPGFILVMLIIVSSGGLIGWIFFDTGYHLETQGLRYHSGPVRGLIPYHKIRSIEVGKTEWVGIRPALATRGITVHYNSFDQVYISPDNSERFVTELRRRVKNLEVKNVV